MLSTGGFSLFHQTGIFQHATNMLQHHDAIGKPVRRNIRGHFGIDAPLLQRIVEQSAVFQRPAQIDMGGAELRINLQAGAQGIDRPSHIAKLP